MAGESKLVDLKVVIDTNNRGHLLELVKNLVALANAGGGKVIVGQTEIDTPGITAAEIKALDSSKLASFAGKYIAPFTIELGHEVLTLLKPDRFVLALIVSASKYPLSSRSKVILKRQTSLDRARYGLDTALALKE